MGAILPSHLREYRKAECAVFRRTGEQFGGLSNMAPGFPILIGDVAIRTSEALYQACRFPYHPDVQRLIIDQRSPMTAKMKSKPYRAVTRSDWDAVRIKIMRWTLRVKLAQNWDTFGGLLRSTGTMPIVEDSHKDAFWGAKAAGGGRLIGRNILGRLLMELRQDLEGIDSDFLRSVEPPAITDFLLLETPIGVVHGYDSKMTSRELVTAGQLHLL